MTRSAAQSFQENQPVKVRGLQGTGTQDGVIVRVGTKLVDIRTADTRVTQFRIKDQQRHAHVTHGAPAYFHTIEQYEACIRRAGAVYALELRGVHLRVGHDLSIGQMEAIVKILEGPR